ncbi:MAG: hypothetical protein QG597_2856 [Actinomycetota bacterium]|nr:hypothetical protein [Actinomycetota bacterium]
MLVSTVLVEAVDDSNGPICPTAVSATLVVRVRTVHLEYASGVTRWR